MPANLSPLPVGPFGAPAQRRRRRWGRWLGVVCVSVLIHLAALDALPHWTVLPEEPDDGEPLRATLAPLVQATAPVVPDATAHPPAPRTPSTSRTPASSRTPRRPALPRPPPVEEPPFVPESLEPPQKLTPAAQAPAAPAAPAPAESSVPVVLAPPAPPPVQASPPRSARLDYHVISQNSREANPIYGHGTITWTVDGTRYSSDLKAAADVLVFSLDVLSSHSDGHLGDAGVVPDRYTESPRKRATVATNFNRDERQSITFSASTSVAPLLPGAQDRLSVLFQIGAFLLADPGKNAPGTQITIPVAGVRGDVEQWRFDVRGDEALETGVGTLTTTHLVRSPRPGSNDRTIDVWVARADGGYPARVLYTEPSGSTVTMTLDRISALATAAADATPPAPGTAPAPAP